MGRAAHASDTLARKLVGNGEHHHKLNFPDDDTEVHRKEVTPVSKYIGVTYNKKIARWTAQRRFKERMVYNGAYKVEERAAHASDTLARKLMENGEHHHKLNFPNDDTEVHKLRKNKRKRPDDVPQKDVMVSFGKKNGEKNQLAD